MKPFKTLVKSSLLRKIEPFIVVFVITFFYFLFHGYKFAVSDEGGWIAYLNKMLNPSLYKNDYFWSSIQSTPHEQLSIFANIDFLASSIFSFNFPLTHFTLLFLTKFLLFLTVYLGSQTIFKNKSAAILTALAFIPSYFFLGPLVGSNENLFIPRVLVQPLILTSIFLAFTNRWLLTSLLAGISFSIHAASLLPVIPLLPVLYLKEIKKFELKKVATVALVFVIGISPLVFKLLTAKPTESPLEIGPISDYLKNVVITRKGYLLLSIWNNQRWIDTFFVFSLGLPFLLFVKNKLAKFKTKILIFYLAIIAANLFYFLVTDFVTLGIFLPLQFPRSIAYIFAINLVLAAGTTIYFLNKRYYFSAFTGILLIIALFINARELFYFLVFLFLLVPFFEKPWKSLGFLSIFSKPLTIFLIAVIGFTIQTLHVITTKYSYEKVYGEKRNKLLWREFIYDRIHFTLPKGDISAQLQLWVKNHTERDAIILVDPDLGFFRNYSQRALVFDHKDLGYIYYSDDAARKIQEREADVANFEEITEEKLIELQNKYKFSYLVWKDSRGNLSFSRVYNQFGFSIYKL